MSFKHEYCQAVSFEDAVQGREGEHTKTDSVNHTVLIAHEFCQRQFKIGTAALPPASKMV